MVSTHNENFNIPAQLESVYKSGTFGGNLDPPREGGGPDFKNLKKPHTERWFEPTPKMLAL